jgi:hypothetical protein
VYKAAVAGQGGNAGASNQFLVPHTGILVYDSAIQQAGQTTGNAKYVTTQDQYLSQQFLTGASQTTIGSVQLQVSVVGGSAITNNITPLTVGIYADSGGEPSGTSLGTATLVETSVYASGFWVVMLLPVTGLTGNTPYHIVVSPAGTSTAYYVWQQNNQVAGASISTDAVAWEDQTFGFMYRVYDQGATGGSKWQYVLEDTATRWTNMTYDGSNTLTGITEYTVDQTGSGSVQYSRTLTYTGGLLTGVN